MTKNKATCVIWSPADVEACKLYIGTRCLAKLSKMCSKRWRKSSKWLNSVSLQTFSKSVAAALPDRITIISDPRILTYKELDEYSSRIAAGLSARGIGGGDHIGLYLRNCVEYLEMFLATVKLRAVPFNVNYRYRGEELKYLFENGDAAVIVHSREFAPILDEIEQLLPKMHLRVAVEDGSDVNLGSSVSYKELVAEQPLAVAEQSEGDATLLYTGGTTGLPKGVIWPHKAFFFACLGGGGNFHKAGPCVTPNDIVEKATGGFGLRMFTVAPLMHGAAIWAAWSALVGGLTLVLDTSRFFDAERV